jgi:hypothetical protein
MNRFASLRSLIGIFLTTLLVNGCDSGASLPPNITYHRVPISIERVSINPEVFTVDNCNASASQERWVERTIVLGDTVEFDEEEARGIATSLGLSYYLEAAMELKSEISKRFGIGLSKGQTKTQGVQINVGPRQTAVVTLQWLETWENGYFEVFKDDKIIGKVNYRLLTDLRLDSSVTTYDCTLVGHARQTIERHVIQAGIFARSAWARMSKWPLGNSESLVLGAALLLTIVITLFRSKRRRPLRRLKR